MRGFVPAFVLLLCSGLLACATASPTEPFEDDEGSAGESGSAGEGGSKAGSAGGPGGKAGSAQAGQGGKAGQAGAAGSGGASGASAGQGGSGGKAGSQSGSGAGGEGQAGDGAGGDGQGGSAQAGSGGSAQAGSGGSDTAGQGGSEQAGSGGSSQAGSGGSSAGSSQAGSGGSAQAGQGGSAQAGSGGSSQAGSGGSEQAGSGGSEQAGSGGSAQAGSGGSSQAGAGGSSGSGGSAGSGAGSGGASGAGPTGDTCPGIPLDVGSELVTVQGNNKTGANNDYEPPCNSGDGRDVVYAVTAASDGFLSVSVDGAANTDPIVFARSGTCANGAALGCSDGISAGDTETVGFNVTAGGTYYVIVDSYGNAAGDFTLKAQIEPLPAGSSCPGEPVSVPAGQTVTFSGTTVNAGADLSGTGCEAKAAPDVVLQVTPEVDGRLDVKVDPEAGFDTKIYLRAACAAGPELGCADGGGGGAVESLSLDVKGGVPLYLVVDGASGDKGAFSASFVLTARPGNDTCATAQAVAIDPGAPLHIDGTTEGALHDATPSKCGSSAKGQDVFYAVTPSKSGNLGVVLDATFDSVLYLARPTCGASGSEIACDDEVGTQQEQATVAVKAGETVWVAVDGYAVAQHGAFGLDLTLMEAPANDDCATAQIVDVPPGPTEIQGTTTAATHQYSGSCSGPSPTEDVVYQLKPTVSGKLVVSLKGSYDSLLYGWSGSCGTSGKTLGCSDSATVGAIESLTFPVMAGQSYWVVVDGYNGKDGPFDLTLDLTEAPANDACASATALDLLKSQPQTLDGDTSAALDDYTASCAFGGTGGDVVYLVKPAVGGKLVISLDATTSTYDPILYAGTGTCGGAPTSCKDSSGTSGTETLTIANAVAGTTYWVVADGVKNTGGPFKITFSLQ